METAKFWVYKGIEPDHDHNTEADAYLLISLEEGEVFELGWSLNHEEGYSSRSERFSFDGAAAWCTVETASRDYDGPLYTEQTFRCPLEELHGRENYDGVWLPAWQEVSASQRDVYAERMGY